MKVKSTYKFPNGMIATCGTDGQQIPELQGEYTLELHKRITEASDENTEWKGFDSLNKVKR